MVQETVSGSPRRALHCLGGEALGWNINETFLPYFTEHIQSKTKQIQTKSQNSSQLKNTFMEELGFS